jgi:hypothetical protein
MYTEFENIKIKWTLHVLYEIHETSHLHSFAIASLKAIEPEYQGWEFWWGIHLTT